MNNKILISGLSIVGAVSLIVGATLNNYNARNTFRSAATNVVPHTITFTKDELIKIGSGTGYALFELLTETDNGNLFNTKENSAGAYTDTGKYPGLTPTFGSGSDSFIVDIPNDGFLEAGYDNYVGCHVQMTFDMAVDVAYSVSGSINITEYYEHEEDVVTSSTKNVSLDEFEIDGLLYELSIDYFPTDTDTTHFTLNYVTINYSCTY